MNQLTDPPERPLTELLLGGAAGALRVRRDESRQMNGPAARNDRVPLDDANLLWIDEGRRGEVCRCERHHKDRQKPDHGICPVHD